VSELPAGSFAFLFLSLALRPPSIIFLAKLQTCAGSGKSLADGSKDIFETASMIFDR
jgi:hypothetical protein